MKKIIIIIVPLFFIYACSNSSKKPEIKNNEKVTNNKLSNTKSISDKENKEILVDKTKVDSITAIKNVADNKKIRKTKALSKLTKDKLVDKSIKNKTKDDIVKNKVNNAINDKKNQTVSNLKEVQNNKTNNFGKDKDEAIKITTAKKDLKQKNVAPTIDESLHNFVKKKNKINGDWSFKQEGNKTYIVFYGNFKTKKGPDLEIFLTKKNIDNVTSKNALIQAIFIENLKSNSGEQKYLIPSNIDLSQYKSIIIHCKKYAVLWGGSSF